MCIRQPPRLIHRCHAKPGGKERQRLKKNAAKALALGAGAIALTVAVPIVLVVDVACEGVKIVLQIVAAPLVLCVLCVSMDDFDF
jgi:hypothetical protein